MPQQRSNKSQTPVNSDAFNLIPDLATFSDSLEVIVPVANDAEGDTVATARATAGWPVSDARPLFVYNTTTKTTRVKDSTGWRDLSDGTARPHAHMGKTANFQALGGVPTEVVMDTAQFLYGGFTFDNTEDALVVPRTGTYLVTLKGFFTGGAASVNQTGIMLNGATPPSGRYQAIIANVNKVDGNDVFSISTCHLPFTAGDKVGMYQYSTVSCWGTNGYDGSYIEMTWAGVWT